MTLRQPDEIEIDGEPLTTILDQDQPDLREADLYGANLRHADLSRADLSEADLRYANLSGANLHGANLHGAGLRYANLRHADLSGANLREADLHDTILSEADLSEADLSAYQIVPEVGSFVAYKATGNHIVRVRIPADARRTSCLASRKCRAEYVEVLDVLNAAGGQCDDVKATGWYDSATTYREGETVGADGWDDDPRVACTNGIHFFVTKDEAIEFL